MSGALEGLVVLDLSRLLPGPYCTHLLADMGATVIKVEDPGGDPLRLYPPLLDGEGAAHLLLNRGKRGVVLNLKHPAGREALLRLAERADVLVEGFRPGVADRLGIGYDAVSTRCPRLVYCSISGYGQDGPYASRPGHDANYLGYAGVLGITGTRGGGPALPGVQIADLGGGALMALFGILAALHRRDRDGRGQHVDVSMLDGMVSWLGVHLAAFLARGGTPPGPGAMPLTGAYPCYDLYRAGDGRWLAVGALEPRFWANLCAALGRPDLLPHQFAQGDEGDAAHAELQSIFAARPRAEWMELLEGAECCVSPVNDLAEALADPQVRHRRMIAPAPRPGGATAEQVGVPVKLSATPGVVAGAAPCLGEHTREVLGEAGYSAAEIEALFQAGAAG